MDEPLWCFRRFMREMVGDEVKASEAAAQYKDYEWQLRRHHAALFYAQHKADGAWRDRYDPVFRHRAFEVRAASARQAAATLLQALQQGLYGSLTFAATAAPHPRVPAAPGASDLDQFGFEHLPSCEVAAHGEPPHYPFDPDVCTLELEAVPNSLSRWDLHDIMQAWPGFVGIWLAPLQPGVAGRAGHARFESAADLAAAVELLSGMDVKGFAVQSKKIVPRSNHQAAVVPASMGTAEQMEQDLEAAQQFVERLDKALGIVGSEGGASLQELAAKAGSAEAKLDLHILYLRRVHHFCFYTGLLCENERDLVDRCGMVCLRAPPGEAGEAGAEAQEADAKWRAQHNERIQRLLAASGWMPQQPNINFSMDQGPLRARWAEQRRASTIDVDVGKYRCARCNKLFKGPEFVEKHLLRVHPEVLAGAQAAAVEDCALGTFLDDSDMVKHAPLPEADAEQPRRRLPTPQQIW